MCKVGANLDILRLSTPHNLRITQAAQEHSTMADSKCHPDQCWTFPRKQGDERCRIKRMIRHETHSFCKAPGGQLALLRNKAWKWRKVKGSARDGVLMHTAQHEHEDGVCGRWLHGVLSIEIALGMTWRNGRMDHFGRNVLGTGRQWSLIVTT